MSRLKAVLLFASALIVMAGAVVIVRDDRPATPSIVGVVRATEITLEPEIGGQLAVLEVRKGAKVRAGDVLARLSAVELTAQLDQARAAFTSAVASRDHVYAGVRREQVLSLQSGIAKAGARLDFVQAQLTRTSTLARQNFESQQALDQAQHDADSAASEVVLATANHAAAVAGPTREERAIADAQVRAAAAAVAVLERRLDKTVLRAPADGVVGVVVAEVGENVRAGQPVLTIEAAGREWLSFNVREDHLGALVVGATVKVGWGERRESAIGRITELRRLGAFATWQARRVVGDHDRSTLRLRIDPASPVAELVPGRTVWIER